MARTCLAFFLLKRGGLRSSRPPKNARLASVGSRHDTMRRPQERARLDRHACWTGHLLQDRSAAGLSSVGPSPASARFGIWATTAPGVCVHVTHSAVARRGMFIVDRVILRLLTDAHCLVAWSLRTAYCCARLLTFFFFFCIVSKLFPSEVFERVLPFFHTFAFSLIYWLWKANGTATLHQPTLLDTCGRPSWMHTVF